MLEAILNSALAIEILKIIGGFLAGAVVKYIYDNYYHKRWVVGLAVVVAREIADNTSNTTLETALNRFVGLFRARYRRDPSAGELETAKEKLAGN